MKTTYMSIKPRVFIAGFKVTFPGGLRQNDRTRATLNKTLTNYIS